jgi:hypothetical protein
MIADSASWHAHEIMQTLADTYVVARILTSSMTTLLTKVV